MRATGIGGTEGAGGKGAQVREGKGDQRGLGAVAEGGQRGLWVSSVWG